METGEQVAAIDIAGCRSLLDSQPAGWVPGYDELIAGGADDSEIVGYLTDLFRPLDGEDFPAGEAPIAGVCREGFGDLDRIVHGLQAAAAELAAVQARQIDLLEQALAWARDAVDEPGLLFGETHAQRMESGHRTVVAELAAALNESTRTMSRRLSQAHSIGQRGDTLAALRDGRLGYTHAMIITETCDSLPVGAMVPNPADEADASRVCDARAALEAKLLPIALASTPAILGRKARALREHMHPEPISERSRLARDERRVVFEPDRDGMGWVHHYLPVINGLRITETLTTMATRAHGAGEHRTIGQLRSDLLTELILNGSIDDKLSLLGHYRTTTSKVRDGKRARRSAVPRMSVTVPMLSFLGLSDEPATLGGYGPIDAETARGLVKEVPSVQRILTHPVTGVVLALDRSAYRVPKALRRWLELRDGTCRDPGCNRPAVGTDIDHTTDWDDGGKTQHDNLACLCRGSHTKKHRLRWRVTQDAGGTLTWASPTGRRYVTEPETPLPAPPLSEPRLTAPRASANDPAPF